MQQMTEPKGKKEKNYFYIFTMIIMKMQRMLMLLFRVVAFARAHFYLLTNEHSLYLHASNYNGGNSIGHLR